MRGAAEAASGLGVPATFNPRNAPKGACDKGSGVRRAAGSEGYDECHHGEQHENRVVQQTIHSGVALSRAEHRVTHLRGVL